MLQYRTVLHLEDFNGFATSSRGSVLILGLRSPAV
jgi:hypothetical protein